MKILILTALFPPLGYSGHDDRCRQVTLELARNGHRVQVLTSSHRVPAMGMPGENAIFRHLTLNTEFSNEYDFSFRELLRFERENADILYYRIEKYSPDLIYIWNLSGLSNSLCFLAQQTDIPVVYDLHSFRFHEDAFRKDPWTFWWKEKNDFSTRMRRLLYTLCGRAYFLKKELPVEPIRALDFSKSYLASQSLKDGLIASGLKDLDDVVVLYPAINSSRIDQKIDYARNHRFMWAGRLVPGKGPDLAINAVARLNEKGIRISLDLFGMGEPIERKQTREYIDSMDLGDQIQMIGIAAGEINSHYHLYDALLFTSRCDDPLPITPLEAMHAGLPTILSKDGGIQELVSNDETAIMYERDNVDALVDAIERFLSLSDAGQSLAQKCIKSLQVKHLLSNYILKFEQLAVLPKHH